MSVTAIACAECGNVPAYKKTEYAVFVFAKCEWCGHEISGSDLTLLTLQDRIVWMSTGYLAYETRKPTLTVGELIDSLEQYDRETPVIAYADNSDYLNISGTHFDPVGDGDIAVVIEAHDSFDTRQW